MFHKYELLFLLKILDHYEVGLVRIIKYYIKTYTFKCSFKNKIKKCIQIVKENDIKQAVDIWYGVYHKKMP